MTAANVPMAPKTPKTIPTTASVARPSLHVASTLDESTTRSLHAVDLTPTQVFIDLHHLFRDNYYHSNSVDNRNKVRTRKYAQPSTKNISDQYRYKFVVHLKGHFQRFYDNDDESLLALFSAFCGLIYVFPRPPGLGTTNCVVTLTTAADGVGGFGVGAALGGSGVGAAVGGAGVGGTADKQTNQTYVI